MGSVNRRRAAGLSACVLGLLCLAGGCGSPQPPDLVVITVDTLRADRLGCYGNPDGLTPALDRLAAEGVLLGDVSAPVPITLPSHTSIFTGRYPNRTGVRNNGTFIVPETETTLAELLREAGWATGAVVAAYPLHARFGLDQGFDVYDNEFPVLAGGDAPGRFFPERDAADVTDRALEVWERLGTTGKRRFLWVHYFDPHAPYDAPQPYASTHGDQRYDAEIAYTDAEIGRLLQTVGEGSTLTVVTSDHGESLGEHGEKTHGLFVYQATMEVPLLFHGGRVPQGVTVDRPASLVDILPTLLNLLEYPVPGDLDGGNLAVLWNRDGSLSRPVYGESFLPFYNYTFSELRMVRDGPLKYIDAPIPELYDLDHDPGELSNLEGGHPDQDRLTTRLAEILASEDPDALEQAAGALDPEAEANLRSLGYMAGGGGDTAGGGQRGRDPKEMVRYIKDMDRVHGIIASGDPDAGFALYERLVEEVPENHMALWHYAGALFGEQRYPDAERQLLRLLERKPDMNQAWVMLGSVRAAMGRIDPAAEAYRMAGSLSRRGEPYFQMAGMYRDVGDYRDAGEAFLEAVRREPSSLEYLEGWMRFHAGRGSLEQAEPLAAELAGMHPDEPAVRFARGEILRQLGRFEEAGRELDAALDLSPGMFHAEMARGDVELKTGHAEAARNRFRILLDRRPGSLPVRFGLARALTLLGDEEAAAELFRRILEERPDFAPVFTFRGSRLEEMGDRAGAEKMYREALRLNRGDREAWEGYQRVRSR